MLSSYHQASECLEIEFNKTKYESLPQELQAILRHAAEAASSTNLWTAYQHYPQDLQELIHKENVHVYRTPESVLKAQLTAWDKVVEQYSSDPFFKKVIDSQRGWAQPVAYYELLNAHDTKLAYDHYYGEKQPLGY
jgi:TRAP-type mannitol/chloroaromatic compound transport system substrate-binding protein